jgi:hypothetical protein
MTPTPSRTRTITPTRTNTPSERGPIVSYGAPVSDDGCEFCCSFSCQAVPTPTPFFDGQGRRIFVRNSGEFLFVIEGARGASGRDPGENLNTTGGTVPDVQILMSNNIGNGSPARCDKGPPPTPFGGVPGFNPPVNDGSPEKVTALQDMACRFIVQHVTTDACTRNRTGKFAFLGTGSRKQFCFSIPQSAEFPIGDTIVDMQLLDTLGNVGPKKEIVIRVEP